MLAKTFADSPLSAVALICTIRSPSAARVDCTLKVKVVGAYAVEVVTKFCVAGQLSAEIFIEVLMIPSQVPNDIVWLAVPSFAEIESIISFGDPLGRTCGSLIVQLNQIGKLAGLKANS